MPAIFIVIEGRGGNNSIEKKIIIMENYDDIKYRIIGV